jgi:hypothetical protein
MANRDVTIRISAQDNFSQVVQKYNNAVRDATRNTKEFDDAGKKVGGGFDNITNAVKGAVTAFIAYQAVGIVTDLVNQGRAANNATAAFTALRGGAEGAAQTLAAMRNATGGVIDDMTLMQNATRLFQMQLANTDADAAKFTEIAVKLGASMGKSANEAMENFSLMLANQSLLRLDTFGISAAAVRERMKELAEEFPNMDKQARFLQATLEQGEKAMGRLGDAANANVNSLTKLEVGWQNFTTRLGQNLADVAITAATTFDQLIQIASIVSDQGLFRTIESAFNPEGVQAADRGHSMADRYLEQFYGSMDQYGAESGAQTGEQMLNTLALAFKMVEEDPSLKDRWGHVIHEVFGLDPDSPAGVAMIRSVRDTYNLARREADLAQMELSRFMSGNYDARGGGSAANPYQDLINTSFRKNPWEDVEGFWGGSSAQQGAMAFDRFREMQSQFGYANDKMTEFGIDTQGIGKFLDPAAFEVIKAEFEELQSLNEQGFISDENLAKAEEFKNQAEAAKDAFEKMSLTDIFGQSSGGMKGEIGDMVIEQMKANGASDEAIAAAQKQFGLASGRETSASVLMQENIAPMIANLSPDEQVKAINNVNTFLELAAKMNLTPDQVAAGLPGAAGFMGVGGAAGSFNITPGMTAGEIAAQNGLTIEQLLAITGASGTNTIPTGTFNLPGGYAPTPGFNPYAYAGGFQNPYMHMPAGGGDGAAINPLIASGFVGEGMWTAHGQDEGADPFAKPAESTELILGNVEGITDEMILLTEKATTFGENFDAAVGPRTLQITVETVDKTNGLLKAILGGLSGTIQLGGGNGTRDNGGVVHGQVSSSAPAGTRPNR